jgi:uncharacterized protein (TIGR03663 family)
MSRSLAFAAAVIVLTAAALAFRLPNLGNRPFHGDEAVHAFKFRDVWEKGVYRYDPNEYHGPTIYYAALPAVAAKGRQGFATTQEADYRLPIAVAGALMIPALLLIRDGLGRRAVLWAGLLTALSPAFVFYSRYYIQEVFLALFTLGFLACWWRYRMSGKVGWIVACGASAGLMIATKETAPIAFVAAGVAWLVTSRLLPEQKGPLDKGKRAVIIKRVAVVAISALAVAYLFLSGFFSHPLGPLGYYQSYTPWLQRARATDIHNYPWSHYLSLLAWTHRAKGPVWSEGLILGLALLGALMAFARRQSDPESGHAGFVRFIAVYTLVLTAIYSAIPYKTPWLVLSFLSGMILLAGYAASSIVDAAQSLPAKLILGGLLLAGCAQLGWQAYRTSFVYHSDGRNPYVYAQPVPDVVGLANRVNELARFHPQKEAMPVKVFSVDEYYWPLPWYLRRLSNVGYWAELPANVSAPIVIASPAFDEALTPRLPDHLMTGIYGLRRGTFMQLFVSMQVWEPYVMSRPKPPPSPDE